MYEPPSSVNVEPSSAVSSAYGMKKTAARKISQVKPCAPLLATAPSVSSPTSVQSRKKSMSKRPKCFLSFAFSSRAAAVVCSTEVAVMAVHFMRYAEMRKTPSRGVGPSTPAARPHARVTLQRRRGVHGGGDPPAARRRWRRGRPPSRRRGPRRRPRSTPVMPPRVIFRHTTSAAPEPGACGLVHRDRDRRLLRAPRAAPRRRGPAPRTARARAAPARAGSPAPPPASPRRRWRRPGSPPSRPTAARTAASRPASSPTPTLTFSVR